MKDEADFTFAQLIYTNVRSTVLDYLVPITADIDGMVINKHGLEELSWLTFFKPLTNQVWILLLLNAFFILCAMRLLQWVYFASTSTYVAKMLSFQKLTDLIGDFWMVGMSYFGRPATDKQRINTSSAISVLFLVVFFVGNLVFMSYKSSLTAELAVKRDKIPFNSLEELFQSDYR